MASSFGTFAEVREALLAAVDRAERQLQHERGETQRRGEAQRRAIAETIQRSIELEAQVSELKTQLDHVRASLADIRDRLQTELHSLDEAVATRSSVELAESEPAAEAELAESEPAVELAEPEPVAELAEPEPAVAGEAQPEEAATAPAEQGTVSTEETVRVLRAALEAFNERIEPRDTRRSRGRRSAEPSSPQTGGAASDNQLSSTANQSSAT